MTSLAKSQQPPTRWLLADILMSYRFWSLLISTVLVHAGFQSFAVTLPTLVMMQQGDVSLVGVHYAASYLGILPGAAFAMVTAGRLAGRGALVLVGLSLVAAICRVALPPTVPAIVTLVPLAIAQSAAQTGLLIQFAVLVHDGKSPIRDFAAAFSLIVASIIAARLAPTVVSLGIQWVPTPDFPAWVLVACLSLAFLLLLTGGRLIFGTVPYRRPRQMMPRRRSVLLVFFSLLLPATVLVASLGRLIVLPFRDNPVEALAAAAILSFLLGLFALAHWLYRVHGELAGMQPARRLIHPLAAAIIGTCVPLGLPILMMMLADLLSDRAKERGDRRRVSAGWAVFWAMLLPPIAAARIQAGINRAHAFHEREDALSAGLAAAIAATSNDILGVRPHLKQR
ncbi:hypothetical protein [Peteryoungia ipomoeae]|uniref:MFS transporter n=1 Tax=Peteryoungia ipomoeae TaxID=1210932 RepID=A0A4V4HNB4_9HYPH|nr:hypothetical protein [Peteryoungia ipomoeae]THV25446.1 hypothetical protein FAA97_04435 [Peteryoungia ipomoeae]